MAIDDAAIDRLFPRALATSIDERRRQWHDDWRAAADRAALIDIARDCESHGDEDAALLYGVYALWCLDDGVVDERAIMLVKRIADRRRLDDLTRSLVSLSSRHTGRQQPPSPPPIDCRSALDADDWTWHHIE